MLRILIVDDNMLFLESARQWLEREGIEVAGVASTGADALRIAEEVHPDVVLLDIALGSESGFDVAHGFAQLPGDIRPKVILVSTYDESDFADMIASCSVVGFVAKAHLSATAIHALVDDADTGDAAPGSPG